jgi:hypothetical protein
MWHCQSKEQYSLSASHVSFYEAENWNLMETIHAKQLTGVDNPLIDSHKKLCETFLQTRNEASMTMAYDYFYLRYLNRANQVTLLFNLIASVVLVRAASTYSFFGT